MAKLREIDGRVVLAAGTLGAALTFTLHVYVPSLSSQIILVGALVIPLIICTLPGALLSLKGVAFLCLIAVAHLFVAYLVGGALRNTAGATLVPVVLAEYVTLGPLLERVMGKTR